MVTNIKGEKMMGEKEFFDRMKKVNRYLSLEERALVWELAKQITKLRWRDEDAEFLSI